MLLLACVWNVACKRNGRAALEQQYTEARLQFQRGYDDEARKAAQDGYDLSANHTDLGWEFRILLADILLREDRAADSLQLLDPEPPTGMPFDVSWRRTLGLSSALCKLHNYSEADHRFAEAERLAGADETLRAELALFHGRCELTRNKLDDAEDFFRRAEQSVKADPFTRMYSLMGLGVCAQARYQWEKAIDLYSRIRESSRILQAAPFEERAMGVLGFAYYELGDLEKAKENSQTAEELARKLQQAHDQDKWLLNTGRAYGAMGQSGLAQADYKKSLAFALKLGDDTIAARCLHNLTQMELAHGTLVTAEQYHDRARNLRLEGDDLRDSNIDEAGIAAAKHDWPRAEALFLELLSQVRSVPRLTWSIQASLARLYAAQGKTALADRWFQRGIETMVEAAARMKHTEFKIVMLDTWPIFDDYIAFLESQKQPERALQVAQMARARTLAEQLGFKSQEESARTWVARIQAMLRNRNAVILAYYEAEHETYLWAITSKHLKSFRLGVEENELETLADSYQAEIQQHSPIDASPAQQKLYQLLIKPVRDLVPKGSHVILVADSALYRINFESLISDEGALHYWIEDAVIENASSIDLLLAGQHKHRAGKGLLLIGAPEQATPEFPSLPHAPEEMASVKQQFAATGVTSFSGSAATPEAYKSTKPGQFKFIEFATHGTASASDPLQSSIVLSRGPHGLFQLYAHDIVDKKLKLSADLVTISACYGAGTFKTSAEGLLGLQWAFMRAGAHQVVAGLWEVDDASSPRLMGGLYSGVVRGQSVAAALRAAKLKMLHSGDKFSMPYYWAPLQVYTGS